MKKLFSFFVIFCMITTLATQPIIINKPLKEFPNIYDLSTPLNAGITIAYFAVNGTESFWHDASSYMNSLSHQKGMLPDRIVNKNHQERLLNDTIKQLFVYKDSIACMIIKKNYSNRYNIRCLVFEDNKWLNLCEDGRSSLEEVQEYFDTYAPEYLNNLRRSNEVKKISTDTLAFVNYVEQYGIEPEEFLLEALAKHSLVIYGEIHRRKVSWDFLSSILSDSRFSETVGTVFVELPAYQQEEFDRFYASKELDTEILLEIFRSFMMGGWWDRGEYEFLINVWRLNQTLPIDKRIKVIPVDEHLPYRLAKTTEDFEKLEKTLSDRNTHMADIIEHTIKTKTDKRNCLFTVGYGHAYKSHVQAGYSSASEQEPALTAGAQLVQRLSNEDVFTVLQHVPIINNFGFVFGFVRQGLFDAAFTIAGNKPVAFLLNDSPFGAEPFDADFNMSVDYRAGNYADNFDGYIFLQALKDEDADYLLYDIISDEFIKELQRRAVLRGTDVNKWFEIEGEITKEKIIKSTKEENENKKRWNELFK